MIKESSCFKGQDRRSDLCNVKNKVLLDLLPGHDQQESLQIVGGYLVEDNLNVQLVV